MPYRESYIAKQRSPEDPELGRFRPIRIASNIVKLLQRYLCPELSDWIHKKCSMQFGFVPGIGCQVARHTVFRQLVRRKNSNLSTIVCQIDLSNAYNTVNLKLLEKRLAEEGIWCSEKLQLWKYIFSRSRTWIEGHIVQEQYGYPKDPCSLPSYSISTFTPFLLRSTRQRESSSTHMLTI